MLSYTGVLSNRAKVPTSPNDTKRPSKWWEPWHGYLNPVMPESVALRVLDYLAKISPNLPGHHYGKL